MGSTAKEISDSDLEAQSAIPTLSQAPTIACPEGQHRPSPVLHWAIVVQGLDEGFRLDRVPLRHTENGDQVWTDIHHHVRGSSLAKRISATISRCFVSIVVGVGTIQEIHSISPTRPCKSLPVSLQKYKDDWLLTEAFHDPTLLVHDTNYISNNKHFTIEPLVVVDKCNGQDAIVIRKVLDKTNITWLLILLLIISPVLGLAIGMCTHRAEVGIAISAGVFALATFLQGLAAWFHV